MTSFHPRKYDSSLFTENLLPMTSGVTKYTLAQYASFPYYLKRQVDTLFLKPTQLDDK